MVSLSDPLFLVGFVVFLLLVGLYMTIVRSDKLREVGRHELRSVIHYGFYLIILVVVLAFSLAFYQESRKEDRTLPNAYDGVLIITDGEVRSLRDDNKRNAQELQDLRLKVETLERAIHAMQEDSSELARKALEDYKSGDPSTAVAYFMSRVNSESERRDFNAAKKSLSNQKTMQKLLKLVSSSAALHPKVRKLVENEEEKSELSPVTGSALSEVLSEGEESNASDKYIRQDHGVVPTIEDIGFSDWAGLPDKVSHIIDVVCLSGSNYIFDSDSMGNMTVKAFHPHQAKSAAFNMFWYRDHDYVGYEDNFALIDDDKIRNCVNIYMAKVLSFYNDNYRIATALPQEQLNTTVELAKYLGYVPSVVKVDIVYKYNGVGGFNTLYYRFSVSESCEIRYRIDSLVVDREEKNKSVPGLSSEEILRVNLITKNRGVIESVDLHESNVSNLIFLVPGDYYIEFNASNLNNTSYRLTLEAR